MALSHTELRSTLDPQRAPAAREDHEVFPESWTVVLTCCPGTVYKINTCNLTETSCMGIHLEKVSLMCLSREAIRKNGHASDMGKLGGLRACNRHLGEPSLQQSRTSRGRERNVWLLSQFPNQKCLRGRCMKHRADSQLYLSSSQPRDEGPRKVRTAGSVK